MAQLARWKNILIFKTYSTVAMRTFSNVMVCHSTSIFCNLWQWQSCNFSKSDKLWRQLTSLIKKSAFLHLNFTQKKLLYDKIFFLHNFFFCFSPQKNFHIYWYFFFVNKRCTESILRTLIIPTNWNYLTSSLFFSDPNYLPLHYAFKMTRFWVNLSSLRP